MPRGRKDETPDETPQEVPETPPLETPVEMSAEEVGGVMAESVGAPSEANAPVGQDVCVNHPERQATQRTTGSGANELFFCDECARLSGEGTQPIESGQPVSAEDAAAAQAAAGPDPTPEEIAAAKAAAGEE